MQNQIWRNKIAIPQNFFSYSYPISEEFLAEIKRLKKLVHLNKEDLIDDLTKRNQLGNCVWMKPNIPLLVNSKNNFCYVLDFSKFDFSKDFYEKQKIWSTRGYRSNPNGDNILIDQSVFNYLTNCGIDNLEIIFNSNVFWFSRSLTIMIKNLYLNNPAYFTNINWSFLADIGLENLFINTKKLSFICKSDEHSSFPLKMLQCSSSKIEIKFSIFKNLEILDFKNVTNLTLLDSLKELVQNKITKITLPVESLISFQKQHGGLVTVSLRSILKKKISKNNEGLVTISIKSLAKKLKWHSLFKK